ncbi:MAG: hypothetical protein ACRDN0_14675 [Trebonia sp.]
MVNYARDTHAEFTLNPTAMETLEPDGQLANNNASGVAQLKWGYGFGTIPPVNDEPAVSAGQS